jgi:hypothetical protein
MARSACHTLVLTLGLPLATVVFGIMDWRRYKVAGRRPLFF